ncbi:uncharacterized protein [Rutidosis leptorrhynchoides]|uniref:uncharacterized protein n=1 Tax=Rutidosis leptorrhynchoides TaxID=125765 RepID=UPI003A99EFBD
MNTIEIVDGDKINAELYNALSEGEDLKAFEICCRLTDGPFHYLTIHNDTVLHVATFNKRNNLVVHLLRSLHQSQYEKLTWVNSSGNTILHETSTNNWTVEAAMEMVTCAPSLLITKNKRGETPLFRAARRGKTKIFRFLDDQVKIAVREGAKVEDFLMRNDKSTILHSTILSQNFELANLIAERYPSLISEVDGNCMTALQLLAVNPSALDKGVGNSFLKHLIYKYIDSGLLRSIGVPIFHKIRKRKRRCELAKKFAVILIEKDKSWKETKSRFEFGGTKLHKYDEGSAIAVEKTSVLDTVPDTPLLLATKSGCTYIVKKILNMYPQSVEHIDVDGRNILHVAIKHRRTKIINIVISMAHSIKRLRGTMDKKGQSLLHMFSVDVKDNTIEDDIRSPVLKLRDDLVLFEKLRKLCTTLARLQINANGMTAESMLLEKNAHLRVEAKEWMISTAQNCSIIAVLIATVAFAAAYTVPGGPNQETGYPLLRKNPFFIVFALADALSLTFSLTSVIIFLSILTSSFRLNDFRYSLHNKLLAGLTVLILSVSMMMVAFAATLVLTISSGQNWTNVLLYIISFFPVTVFVFSYVRLYLLLINSISEMLLMFKEAVFPSCTTTTPQTDFTRSPYKDLHF